MDGEKLMENPIKMDDLGGFPPIFGNTHIELTPDVTFVLLKLEYQFHISLFEALPLNTPPP